MANPEPAKIRNKPGCFGKCELLIKLQTIGRNGNVCLSLPVWISHKSQCLVKSAVLIFSPRKTQKARKGSIRRKALELNSPITSFIVLFRVFRIFRGPTAFFRVIFRLPLNRK